MKPRMTAYVVPTIVSCQPIRSLLTLRFSWGQSLLRRTIKSNEPARVARRMTTSCARDNIARGSFAKVFFQGQYAYWRIIRLINIAPHADERRSQQKGSSL